MKTKNRRPRATSSGQRRRRREEQLELDLAPPAKVARLTPDLRGTSRVPPVSETQAKRLRAGVLVQQMLK